MVEVKEKPESDAWLADGIAEIERQLKNREAEKGGDEQAPAADSAEVAERFKVASRLPGRDWLACKGMRTL